MKAHTVRKDQAASDQDEDQVAKTQPQLTRVLLAGRRHIQIYSLQSILTHPSSIQLPLQCVDVFVSATQRALQMQRTLLAGTELSV